jgi:hypothetical protein
VVSLRTFCLICKRTVSIDSIGHILILNQSSAINFDSAFGSIAFVFVSGFAIAVGIGNQDSAASVLILIGFNC